MQALGGSRQSAHGRPCAAGVDPGTRCVVAAAAAGMYYQGYHHTVRAMQLAVLLVPAMGTRRGVRHL